MHKRSVTLAMVLAVVVAAAGLAPARATHRAALKTTTIRVSTHNSATS
jgi:hypothetical protein